MGYCEGALDMNIIRDCINSVPNCLTSHCNPKGSEEENRSGRIQASTPHRRGPSSVSVEMMEMAAFKA